MSSKESVDDGPRVKQLGETGQTEMDQVEAFAGGGAQICPVGGDDGARAVREDHQQLRDTVAFQSPCHFEDAALQRVVLAGDRDGRRNTFDVGSVWWLSWKRSSGRGMPHRVRATSRCCQDSRADGKRMACRESRSVLP